MDEGRGRMGGTPGRTLASAAVQALACLALPASALAQAQPPPPSPSAQAQPAAKPAARPARKPAAESEKQDDPTVVSEVVINASAAPYYAQPGAVVVPVRLAEAVEEAGAPLGRDTQHPISAAHSPGGRGARRRAPTPIHAPGSRR